MMSDNKKFIFSHYFGDTSIFSGNIPNMYNGRGHYACKFVEIFYLWYLYVRKFLPQDYHIFWTDAASPIGIDWMLELIDEPIQILEESEMDLDFSKKIHVRKQKGLVSHQQGWIRVTKDWWRICIHNNIDFFTVEGDGLIAYDVTKDFEGKDCLMRQDDPYQGTVYYIKNNLFHKNIHQFNNMSDFLNHLDNSTQGENHLATSEGGMREVMKLGENFGSMSDSSKCLQDCSVQDFKQFVQNNPIDHFFLNKYITNLK